MPKVVHDIERAPDATGLDLAFFCPACQCGHGISRRPPGPVWKFNGDYEKPTIDPSIRVTSRMWNEAKQDYDESCCHTTITDGIITFCGDCTHAMANQSVPLEEF